MPTGDVVLGAVGVDHEHDPDLARVDDLGDARVDAVAVDEPVEDVQRHLGRHVLVGVVGAVEHDLGLVLVGRDVVRDLDRPDVAALVALADREARHDRRVGGRHGGDLGGDLGVAVVALLAGRELGRGHDRRRAEARAGWRGWRRGPTGDGIASAKDGASGRPCHRTDGPARRRQTSRSLDWARYAYAMSDLDDVAGRHRHVGRGPRGRGRRRARRRRRDRAATPSVCSGGRPSPSS